MKPSNQPYRLCQTAVPNYGFGNYGQPNQQNQYGFNAGQTLSKTFSLMQDKRSFRSDVSAPRCLESDRNRNIWSCQVFIQLEIRHFSIQFFPPTLIPQFAHSAHKQRAQRPSVTIWGQQNNWFNQPQASGSTQQARVYKSGSRFCRSRVTFFIWCGKANAYWCIEIINNIY